jgi:Arc/MetJ-type ribon-helix-helix transcriptional regulator
MGLTAFHAWLINRGLPGTRLVLQLWQWSNPMKTVTVKLPETLAARLDAVAKRRRSSKSVLIRDALEAFLQDGQRAHNLSCYELTSDLAGCLSSGVGDLSSNKEHLEDFGR